MPVSDGVGEGSRVGVTGAGVMLSCPAGVGIGLGVPSPAGVGVLLGSGVGEGVGIGVWVPLITPVSSTTPLQLLSRPSRTSSSLGEV